MRKFRSALYTTAKILGDINAVQKGKILPRLKNRILGKLLSKLFK